MSKDVIVFHSDVHWSWKFKGYDTTDNLRYYVAVSSPRKFALLEIEGQWDWVTEKELFDEVYKCSEHVFIRCREWNYVIPPLLKYFDKPNVTFLFGFHVNWQPKFAKFVFNSAWFHYPQRHYLKEDKWLTDAGLTQPQEKKYMFECMFGLKKPHRHYIKEHIKYDTRYLQSELHDASTTYAVTMGDPQSLFWENDISLIPGDDRRVTFMDKAMYLSEVMPFKVYNSSWYSMICETWYHNEASFYTEKITKPIQAKRIVMVVSGQYYLKNLRSLGFKTFDGIIDESYDEVENQIERYDMLLTEAEKLMQRDPLEVYEEAKDIVEHNQEWLKTFTNHHNEVVKLIESHFR